MTRMWLTSQEIALRDLMLAVGLKRTEAKVIVAQESPLSHDFDVSAEDFLQQAKDDFELGGNNARLNALSNAKRAIHAQVDEVLMALGFKTDGSFRARMDLLSDLGFISPRILKRVNDARDLLEHEYHPTQAQLEEAIDLASLFLRATKRHMLQWVYELNIGNQDEHLAGEEFKNEMTLVFDDKQKSFYLAGYRGIILKEISRGCYAPAMLQAHLLAEIEVKAGDRIFNDFVKLVLAAGAESPQEKTWKILDELFARLRIP